MKKIVLFIIFLFLPLVVNAEGFKTDYIKFGDNVTINDNIVVKYDDDLVYFYNINYNSNYCAIMIEYFDKNHKLLNSSKYIHNGYFDASVAYNDDTYYYKLYYRTIKKDVYDKYNLKTYSYNFDKSNLKTIKVIQNKNVKFTTSKVKNAIGIKTDYINIDDSVTIDDNIVTKIDNNMLTINNIYYDYYLYMIEYYDKNYSLINITGNTIGLDDYYNSSIITSYGYDKNIKYYKLYIKKIDKKTSESNKFLDIKIDKTKLQGVKTVHNKDVKLNISEVKNSTGIKTDYIKINEGVIINNNISVGYSNSSINLVNVNSLYKEFKILYEIYDKNYNLIYSNVEYNNIHLYYIDSSKKAYYYKLCISKIDSNDKNYNYLKNKKCIDKAKLQGVRYFKYDVENNGLYNLSENESILDDVNITINNELIDDNIKSTIKYKMYINIQNDDNRFNFKLPNSEYENLNVSFENEKIEYDIENNIISFKNLEKGKNQVSISYDVLLRERYDHLNIFDDIYKYFNKYDSYKVRFVGNNLDKYDFSFNSATLLNSSNESVDYTVYTNFNKSFVRISYNKQVINKPIKTKNFLSNNLLVIYIPIILAIFSLIIYYTLNKKIQKNNYNKEYPSDKYNSLDTSYINHLNNPYFFINNKKIYNNEVTSLIIYLANNGYLRFSDTDKNGNRLEKGHLALEKMKDYDGKDDREKELMNILFKNGNKVLPSEISGLDKVINKIINKTLNNDKLYDNSKIDKLRIIFYVFIFVMILVLFVTVFKTLDANIIILLFIGFILFVISSALAYFLSFCIKIIIDFNHDYITKAVFLGFIIGIMIFSRFFFGTTFNAYIYELNIETFKFIHLFLYSLCLAIIYTCFKNISCYTEEVIIAQKQSEKFIKYLNNLTNNDVVTLLDTHPDYLEIIYPYVYALNLDEIVYNSFKYSDVRKPKWIDSYDNYGIEHYMEVKNFLRKIE